MKFYKIALGFALIPLTAFSANQSCKYSLDSSSAKVEWTAFKTTEKTAVKGTLPGVELKSPAKGSKSLIELLKQTKATGQINDEKKSDSGNPARDTTLFQKFFALIADQGKFQGSIAKVEGDEKSGDLKLNLGLNGKTKKVRMKYTFSETGAFEASGEFDINDFEMQPALSSLHQACEVLHKGKDGISKTWPIVGITITANIKKDCTKK